MRHEYALLTFNSDLVENILFPAQPGSILARAASLPINSYPGLSSGEYVELLYIAIGIDLSGRVNADSTIEVCSGCCRGPCQGVESRGVPSNEYLPIIFPNRYESVVPPSPLWENLSMHLPRNQRILVIPGRYG